MNCCDWLRSAARHSLASVLTEYRYLVHRFPSWLALVIARSGDAEVGRLLLPNLLEETGVPPAPSHLALLDRCLESCSDGGLLRARAVLHETAEAEAWFVSVCATESTLAGLALLGPGTESISAGFLEPLEEGLLRAFGSTLDRTYFDQHRAEFEASHAAALDAALELCVGRAQDAAVAAEEVGRWAAAARMRHELFWADMERRLGTEAGVAAPPRGSKVRLRLEGKTEKI